MATSAGNPGSCLHLVARPGEEILSLCVSQFRDGDSVLFIDSGVMALAGPQATASGFPPDRVLFAEADVAARGLMGLARKEKLRLLPDERFADLLFRHEFCLTWK
jgi:sulfur relay protein TusB/DsrH